MPLAIWNGRVIADSVEVVDGYPYFPAQPVDRRYLRDSADRSVSPWKGTAGYYDVVVDGEENGPAAWHYPDLSPRAAPLVGGRIAFWRGVRIERSGDVTEGRGLLGRPANRLR
ncbi:MAG: DUF427 domain-containing protein [Actinobacteria bacterium]|nr:DUF427 domain-containing protein [Actinomycetota bacterium]